MLLFALLLLKTTSLTDEIIIFSELNTICLYCTICFDMHVYGRISTSFLCPDERVRHFIRLFLDIFRNVFGHP